MRLIDESLWNAAIYAVEYLNDTSLLRKLIAEAEEPTIEAEPVRHGRWIQVGYDVYVDGNLVYDEWECSECHFRCRGEGEPNLNYCPNCGLKMDGGEE